MAVFYNQAAFTYNGNTVNSNITSGEIVQALTAEKTALVPEYTPSGDVTYIISIINSSDSAYTGLTITDDLGAYVNASCETVYPLDVNEGSVKYYSDGVEQPSPTVNSVQPLIITGIDVPADGNAIIIYQAKANSYASPAADGQIINTAVISGSSITEDIIVTETVTAEQQPIISMVKTLSPKTVNENSRVTYTFTVYNYGNTEVGEADNAVITDTFSPALTNITVELNGQQISSGYTYDEESGFLTTLTGLITVPAATVSQDLATGEYSVDPGTAVMMITGTI